MQIFRDGKFQEGSPGPTLLDNDGLGPGVDGDFVSGQLGGNLKHGACVELGGGHGFDRMGMKSVACGLTVAVPTRAKMARRLREAENCMVLVEQVEGVVCCRVWARG